MGSMLVGPAGIEPATLGLEIRCSILLSYGPKLGFSSVYQLRMLALKMFPRDL